MTVSLSIFDKICPSCAARISVSAERCHCGHHFDSSEPSEQEAALRDEEIYEGYLAARAAQAHEAAHVARQALFDDTDNAELQSALDLASEVAKSLDADLAEQRAKIAQLRSKLPARKQESAPKADTTSKSLTPASRTAAPKLPASRQTAHAPAVAAKPPKKSPQPRMDSPVAGQPVTAQLSVPVVSPVTVTAAIPPAVVAPPAPHLSSPANAASVLETIRNANARERALRNPPADEVVSPAAAPAAFRAEQAERAEKALNVVLHHSGKDCPNCTSNVPVNTTRCRCGFQFESGSSDMPSLTLCTGDFSALRDSLNLNLRRS